MCDYSEFWKDLLNLPQEDVVSKLVELFGKYGLLNEDGKPKETLHFELKRWKNDYMHDAGRKELTEHIIAMANTIVKNPTEMAIMTIGIAEEKPLSELPYKQDPDFDKLKIIVDRFVNGLIAYIRNYTIPEFPVEEIERYKINIERNGKDYPLVFLKIPVKISHFYGIKSGDEEVFCLKFVKREIKDRMPEKRMRSALHLFKDVHKGVLFDAFSSFGYPREILIKVNPENLEILDKGIPLDIIELEKLVGRETSRRRMSYWDYLIEKKFIQTPFDNKWVISYSALLLFGSRNVQLKDLTIPEIEISVNVESDADTEDEEQGLLQEYKSFRIEGSSPQTLSLIPLRKAFEEVFNVLEEVLSMLSLPYYNWEELKPAFYEILLNSVLHNNYYDLNPKIRIELRETSIYVENKCLWDLSGLPIEKLASRSFPRPNPVLYEHLERLKFLENKFPDFLHGESAPRGLMNLLKYLIYKGFPVPSFNLSGGIFGIELPVNIEFQEQIRRIDDILLSKELFLRGEPIRSVNDLEISELLALYLQVVQQVDNPEQKFNEFFEGTLGIYKDFVDRVQQELNQSGGE